MHIFHSPHTTALAACLVLSAACRSDDSPDAAGGTTEGSSGTEGGDVSGMPTSGAEASSSSDDGSSGGAPDESPYPSILETIDTPGAQLAVLEPDGDAWFGVTGVASSGEPMTAEHQLLIGSNTKTWTAAITLMLVDEGAMSLEDSSSTWVTGLDPTITVRDLLQHTSGLGEYFAHPDMQEHTGDAWTPQELITLGRGVRDDGPGPSVYANTNYIALGLILEGIEQQPFEEVLQARVLDPLGLDDSGLIVDPEAIPPTVAFGDGGAYGVVTPSHPSVGWAAGSGYSTAEDLAEFYRAMLGGELYGDELLALQLDDMPSDLGFGQPGVTEAYGLGLMMLDVGGQSLTGHLGAVPGFHSWGLRDDASGALAVVLTNNSEVTSIPAVLEALAVASGQ
ncbi:MAG: serine hydrolase domain-containing protein [Myxococcota bacterium]